MIQVNIKKAKTIAHELRRAARAKEFAPHDEVIAKHIPDVDMQVAESARQSIREKYAAIQIEIEKSTNIEQLKVVLNLT